ncbi:MAG: aminotransferase class I/II-fold pyridoxal phosphate-dependent enzyme, partial [Dongiaceae bacterium]
MGVVRRVFGVKRTPAVSHLEWRLSPPETCADIAAVVSPTARRAKQENQQMRERIMVKLASGMGRLGTESAFEVLARAKALEAQGRSIINLGIGQPDFRTPEHIVEAAIKALRDGHHGYTPANGILPLREAVSEDLLRRHNVKVHPDHVVVVPGGKVTMFFAVLMFGEPGAEIIYP